MHPAPSIIAFSTFSGLGFGLLAWLGFGYPGVTGWVAFAFFVIAYALACGGLIASPFHLGHPERALKAFSQWKSSWLSREGIAAVAALVTMGLYAFALIFFDTRIAVLGWLGAALCIATVFTTSMIYAQLKTVPRWNTPLTSVLFVTLSLAGGALLAAQTTAALVLLGLAAIVQTLWWINGDRAFAASNTTLATATGLSGGKLRAFEPPHTGTNYLMREMVHHIGRKHAAKLRIIAALAGYAVPIALLLLPVGHFVALLAIIIHAGGILASRWLFFAEAEHVVGLYYGKR